MDKRSAEIEYNGTYKIPEPLPVKSYVLDRFEFEISWLRIFEDDNNNKYYQWMQSDTYCMGTYCPSQLVSLNEDHVVSGSFLVYYPMPEKYTRPISPYEFDYVQWISKNMKEDEWQTRIIKMISTEDKTYSFRYKITSGEIVGTVVDFPASSLMIVTNSTSDGILTVELPRSLIDSKSNGTDDSYFVAMGDYTTGNGVKPVDYTEIETTDDKRILMIAYPKGTTLIEISGTYIVPEFPVNLMLVTVIGLIGGLIASRFNRNVEHRSSTSASSVKRKTLTLANYRINPKP